MLNTIIDILSENNIQNFLINECKEHTKELFFVKHSIDQSRSKDVLKYDITLYKDFSLPKYKDNIYRGSSTCQITPAMTKDEITNKIKTTYNTASLVKNNYYPLAKGDEIYSTDSNSSTNDLYIPNENENLTTSDLAKAAFDADNSSSKDSFINSLEIFETTQHVRIINSNGFDKTYTTKIFSGEYVVQSTIKEDVELFYQFEFNDTSKDICKKLASQITSSLKMAKDRSLAIDITETNYNKDCKKIILQGDFLSELFNYYLSRSDASLIYQGYSNFKPDLEIPSNTDISITTMPTVPYSREGIKLAQYPVVKHNKIVNILGDLRFSFYMRINPLGTYNSYKMNPGNAGISDYQNNTYLRITNFSDFQTNALTGEFGGEFRLAYYYDGTKEIPVTKGSFSGNIKDILSSLELSKEIRETISYQGPKWISFNK